MRINTRSLCVLLLCGALLPLAGCGRQSVVVLNPDPVAPDKGGPADPEKRKDDGDQPKADGFRFAEDSAGQHLGKLLPPRENIRLPAERPSGPRSQPLPALENPALPLPPGRADIVRLPVEKAPRPPRPPALPEEMPLLGYRGVPAQPQEPVLTPGVLLKVPSPNVGQPVPPPLLAQPAPDRVPLDDPTLEASLAAAVAAQPSYRTNPAPFLKLTLPDPFENRQTVRLRSTPPEEGMPVAATPQLPK
jgi:hypothetical protein